MDQRTKELVAIAVSVAARCQPCLRHHLAKAKELDIPDEEVQEAIALALKVDNAGHQRMEEFAQMESKK